MMEIEFTDRYKALGIPYPDVETMCKGQCEGTGWVPIHKDDDDPEFFGMWAKAEEGKCSQNGYHIIKCPRCKGSGKRPNDRS